MRGLLNLVLALSLAAGSAWGFAAQTLITMPGPKAGLAKSFKSLGKGKYQFQLDTTQQVKKGSGTVPVTFEIVQKSLERQLKAMNAKVSGGGTNVEVAYNGEESAFLNAVANAEIKQGAAAGEMEVGSTVSDGGIRARAAARELGPKEVSAAILGPDGGNYKVRISERGKEVDATLKNIKVKLVPPPAAGVRQVFFVPVKKGAGDVWEVSDVKYE